MSKAKTTPSIDRVNTIVEARLTLNRWDMELVQSLNESEGWNLKRSRLYELNQEANKEIDKLARDNQVGMLGRLQRELLYLYDENKSVGDLREARQCLLSLGKLYSLID